MNNEHLIRLAMIERTAYASRETIMNAVLDEYDMKPDDFAFHNTASDSVVELDTEVTEENFEDVVKFLTNTVEEIPENNPEGEDIEADVEDGNDDELKNELQDVKNVLDNSDKTDGDIDVISKIIDMVMALLVAKPENKDIKSASDVRKIACDYKKLAYEILSETWENMPSGRQRTKNPHYKGPNSGTSKFIYRDKEGEAGKPSDKKEDKKESPKKEDFDPKKMKVDLGFGKVPFTSLPKPLQDQLLKHSEEQKEETPEESKKEEPKEIPEESKKEEPKDEPKEEIKPSVKTLGKPKPKWFSPDKFSTNDTESLKKIGFSSIPKDFAIKEDSVLVSLKTGESYRFGDLPKAAQEKIIKRTSEGSMMKAPSSETPKEEAPKEDIKKEEKPDWVKTLEDPKDEKTKPKKKINPKTKKKVNSIFSLNGKNPILKGLSNLIGKEVGGAKKFKKDILDTINNTVSKSKDTWINAKKSVKDMFEDIVSSVVSNYEEGISEGLSPSRSAMVGRIASSFNINAALTEEEKDKVVENVMKKMSEKSEGEQVEESDLADIGGPLEPDEQVEDTEEEPVEIEEEIEEESVEIKEEPVEEKTEDSEEIKEESLSDVDSSELVIASIREAARGLQMNRKDKDLMNDTGGSSYKRNDPKIKPPRDDVRKPFSVKNKKPGDYDKDVDIDPDMKASIASRIADDVFFNSISSKIAGDILSGLNCRD